MDFIGWLREGDVPPCLRPEAVEVGAGSEGECLELEVSGVCVGGGGWRGEGIAVFFFFLLFIEHFSICFIDMVSIRGQEFPAFSRESGL